MTLWSTFCRASGLSGLFPASPLMNSEAMGRWPRDTERDVDIVTGCLFLLKRATWARLGGFDPAFVMYGEEVDLCMRAKAVGMQPRVTPDAVIVHYGAASDTVRPDKMVRLLRAKTELIKRHFPAHSRWLGRQLFRLWPLSRAVALGVAGRLTGRADWREKAGEWRAVWDRRSEWQGGLE
jgi:GT2 family glycosyltransferase